LLMRFALVFFSNGLKNMTHSVFAPKSQ